MIKSFIVNNHVSILHMCEYELKRKKQKILILFNKNQYFNYL